MPEVKDRDLIPKDNLKKPNNNKMIHFVINARIQSLIPKDGLIDGWELPDNCLISVLGTELRSSARAASLLTTEPFLSFLERHL